MDVNAAAINVLPASVSSTSSASSTNSKLAGETNKSNKSADFKSNLNAVLKKNKDTSTSKDSTDQKTKIDNILAQLQNLEKEMQNVDGSNSNEALTEKSQETLADLLQQLTQILNDADIKANAGSAILPQSDLKTASNDQKKKDESINSDEIQALIQVLNSIMKLTDNSTQEASGKSHEGNQKVNQISDNNIVNNVQVPVIEKSDKSEEGSRADTKASTETDTKVINTKDDNKSNADQIIDSNLNNKAGSDINENLIISGADVLQNAKNEETGSIEESKQIGENEKTNNAEYIAQKLSTAKENVDIKKENVNTSEPLKQVSSEIAQQTEKTEASKSVSEKVSREDLKDLIKQMILNNQGDTMVLNNKFTPHVNVKFSGNTATEIIKTLVSKLSEEITDKTSEKQNGQVEQVSAAKSDQIQTIINNLKLIKQTVENENSELKTNISSTTSKVSSDISETEFLKDLVNNADSSKQNSETNSINKVNNFMNMLNEVKENPDVKIADKPIINKETILNDVIKTVKYMETNNVKDLTVKINPKDLGELVIKLTSEGGVMKANITASTKEAYSILNSNIDRISSELNNQDIKVQNLSLSLFDSNSANHNSSGNGQQNQGGSKAKTLFYFGDDTEQTTNEAENDESSLDIII